LKRCWPSARCGSHRRRSWGRRAVEAGELAATVRLMVAELPPGQRRAVELFYLGDLTLAETAGALGIEVGTVKARLHKVRLALRRRFESRQE
jgi:RNA polymerase sigma factor (sigma-70 family)